MGKNPFSAGKIASSERMGILHLIVADRSITNMGNSMSGTYLSGQDGSQIVTSISPLIFLFEKVDTPVIIIESPSVGIIRCMGIEFSQLPVDVHFFSS